MLTMSGSKMMKNMSRIEQLIRQCSTVAKRKQDVFYDSEVQGLLKKLTGLNYQKIFRTRRIGEKIEEKAVYQFLTDQELERIQKETEVKALEKLQMPPVMDVRKPAGRVLEKDPLLIGFDISKVVFTDITYGISERERIVVVRDTDGTLRTAEWEELDRINQTYYPRPGRKHTIPALFDRNHLETILGPDKYEYILDRNCLQFEPDNPVYISTAELVYNHINENKHFNQLHSTRHYGPMVFYLCSSQQIDEFLIHQILNHDLEGAVNTIKVYQIINQDFSFSTDGDARTVISRFSSSAAKKGQKIAMALERVA